MEVTQDAKKQTKTKKRIAPEKESDIQVSIPENIIEASFETESDFDPISTAGAAQGGITINILNSPMVHAQQVPCFPTPASIEGVAGTTRTQLNVVKRVLERQTRLYQVRDTLSDPEEEDFSEKSDIEGRSVSELQPSEEGNSSNSQNGNMKGDEEKEDGKEEDMEVELGQETEEWGLRNIGDYDLEDDFIDDSEVHHYFENVAKKTKYSGFYIHKGPLKMIEQKSEPKVTKKGKVETKVKASTSQPKPKTPSADKKKPEQQVSYANVPGPSINGPVPALPLASTSTLADFRKRE